MSRHTSAASDDEYRVSFRAVRETVALLAADVDADQLCRSVGIERSTLSADDPHATGWRIASLYESAARLSGDPDYGLHLGLRAEPFVISARTFAFFQAPALGSVVQ